MPATFSIQSAIISPCGTDSNSDLRVPSTRWTQRNKQRNSYRISQERKQNSSGKNALRTYKDEGNKKKKEIKQEYQAGNESCSIYDPSRPRQRFVEHRSESSLTQQVAWQRQLPRENGRGFAKRLPSAKGRYSIFINPPFSLYICTRQREGERL